MWTEHVQASVSPRMKDDGAEEKFWQEFMKTKVYGPDASSRAVMAYLNPIFKEYGIQSALEFGPGWGNYTLDLAEICEELTCVDISQSVLDFVIRAGKEHGFQNISGIHSKWEEFSADQKYDLVFGYNCFYRQEDLEACFRKMNQASRKLCVVGMNTGLAPQWVHELENAGGQVSWEWKDYIYFVGVLYQMGIDANVRVLPFYKELCYNSTEELIEGELRRCGVTGVDPQKAKDILCRHFKKTEDGSWRGTVSFRSGIVWWESTDREER